MKITVKRLFQYMGHVDIQNKMGGRGVDNRALFRGAKQGKLLASRVVSLAACSGSDIVDQLL